MRIVAATHRDLQALIAEARFREYLWYRISVFPIHLPPLRDRAEDVAALANHFALRASTRFGTPPRIPSQQDLEHLVSYSWPGNVRELIAVMERAVILGNGERLEVVRRSASRPARRRRPRAARLARRVRASRSSHSTWRWLATSKPRSPARAERSRAAAAPRSCSGSTRTRCARGCGGYRSIGAASALTRDSPARAGARGSRRRSRRPRGRARSHPSRRSR